MNNSKGTFASGQNFAKNVQASFFRSGVLSNSPRGRTKGNTVVHANQTDLDPIRKYMYWGVSPRANETYNSNITSTICLHALFQGFSRLE